MTRFDDAPLRRRLPRALRHLLAGGLALALVLSACGGDDGDDAATGTGDTTTDPTVDAGDTGDGSTSGDPGSEEEPDDGPPTDGGGGLACDIEPYERDSSSSGVEVSFDVGAFCDGLAPLVEVFPVDGLEVQVSQFGDILTGDPVGLKLSMVDPGSSEIVASANVWTDAGRWDEFVASPENDAVPFDGTDLDAYASGLGLPTYTFLTSAGPMAQVQFTGGSTSIDGSDTDAAAEVITTIDDALTAAS